MTKKIFSKREIECLQKVAEGLTSKSIAKELGISYRTVDQYIDAARKKVGCRNRCEMISLLTKYSDILDQSLD